MLIVSLYPVVTVLVGMYDVIKLYADVDHALVIRLLISL